MNEQIPESTANPYDSRTTGRLNPDTSPGMLVLLTIVTCGFYLIYWYYQVYCDIEVLTGSTPTGLNFVIDIILSLITGGIWAIYIDYRISVCFNDLHRRYNMPVHDTAVLTIVLDIAAYFTVAVTYIITSFIHQDQLNKIKAVVRSGVQPSP